jgi:hypothetical protein
VELALKQCGGYGISVSSDGWENVKKEPIINVMILSVKEDFFYNSWNIAQHVKYSNYLKRMWIQYISTIGKDFVLQIITEDVSAKRKAKREVVEIDFSYIT